MSIIKYSMIPVRFKPEHDYIYRNHVVEIPNVMSLEECARIIDFANSDYSGLHRRGSKDKNTHASFYTCLITTLTDQVYPMLSYLWEPYTDITFIEPYEVKMYVEGDEFELHQDGYINIDVNANRRMNLIIQLSDQSSYDGGDLIVGDYQCTRQVGSAILFPAVLMHKVTTITKGQRYSLIGHGWGPYHK